MCSVRARRCRAQCDVLLKPQLATILPHIVLSHFCACSSCCCCCCCNPVYFRIFEKTKTTVFTMCFATGCNNAVFSVFVPVPRLAKKHRYLRSFTMFCFPSAAKNGSKRLKTAKIDFQKHPVIPASHFPAPDPQKRENTSRVKDFLGDGRAPEQLKLGKLQATPPYGEASPDCGGLSDIRCSRLRSGSAH